MKLGKCDGAECGRVKASMDESKTDEVGLLLGGVAKLLNCIGTSLSKIGTGDVGPVFDGTAGLLNCVKAFLVELGTDEVEQLREGRE